MFPQAYLDHFENPRNQGRLDDPTHRGQGEDPACGDRLWLDLRVVDGVVQAARFRVQGCSGSIAAGSALAHLAEGRPARADAVSREQIDTLLGGVPASKRHALRLATRVLEDALGGDTSGRGTKE